MRKIVYTGLLGCGLLLSGMVQALTIDEAKQQGKIGETLSGYLAAVKPEPRVLKLVAEINQKRTKQYQIVAEQNGTSVAAVANMAGEKLVSRAEKGEYVQGINGQWRRR